MSIDTTKKYGRLKPIRFLHKNNDNRDVWLFLCDCGNEHTVNIKDVKSGHSKSCGCLARELLVKRNYKHGHSKHNNIGTPEFKAWLQMKKRIFDKTYHAYEHYKERGINICDRWLDKEKGFINFYKDMGRHPGKDYSLDRINNSGNYEPDNCRWATRKEQMNNTSSNKFITYNGVTLTQAQWTEKIGLPNSNVIHKRIKRGWSIEKTLTTPLMR